MDKVIVLLFAFFAVSIAESTPCPPLQLPEKMTVSCMDPKTNVTVECTSSNATIPKGTVVQYRCKSSGETEWANGTMKCICRGRWVGLFKFNEFAKATCDSSPMVINYVQGDINGTTAGQKNESSVPETLMEPPTTENATATEGQPKNASSSEGNGNETVTSNPMAGNESESDRAGKSISDLKMNDTKDGSNSTVENLTAPIDGNNVTASDAANSTLSSANSTTSGSLDNSTSSSDSTTTATLNSSDNSTSSDNTTSSTVLPQSGSENSTTSSSTNSADNSTSSATASPSDSISGGSDNSSSTTPSSTDNPASGNLTTSADNSSPPSLDNSTSESSTSTDNSSSTTPTSADNSTLNNAADNSTSSSSDTSSLGNATSSDNSSSTTPSSTDNSDNSTSSSANNSSSTTPSSTDNSTSGSPSSDNSTADDSGSRQSKELSLPSDTQNSTKSPETAANTTSTGSPNEDKSSTPASSTSPSTENSTETSPTATTLESPTSGASLAVMNSSMAANVTGSDSSTQSPANSTTGGSESSSTEKPDGNATTPNSMLESQNSTSSNGTLTGTMPENVTSGNATEGNFTECQTIALELHNKLRKNHNSQPLALNETLNNIAQTWADTVISHSKLDNPPGKRPYAQNLYKATGGSNMTAHEAVKSAIQAWYGSSKGYNYSDPKPTGFSQIVWNATTQLGVGVATKDGTAIVVATYSPRGNVISVRKNGQNETEKGYFFTKNVFPLIHNPVDVFESNSTTSKGNSTEPQN